MNRRDPFGWIGHSLDGKIAIEAVAGEGGFGVVYRGTHLGFAEPVAVKFLKLPPQLAANERDEFLAAFLTEARVLRKLCRASPKIVEALDVGAAVSPSGVWTPYLTMEWLEGESLEAALARAAQTGEPPLDLATAVHLLAPIADALSVAHELGVAHRDVKPANLFLSQLGENTVFKVVDFGIAKLVTEGQPKTTTPFAAFSPQWSAPEQFEPSLGDTGPWTDVFAFALVLLELVSGRHGLAGATYQELFESSVRKPRPTFASRNVAASEEAERVLARALAVDPRNRFASMRDLFRALEGVAGVTHVESRSTKLPWSKAPGPVSVAPNALAATVESAFDATAVAPEDSRTPVMIAPPSAPVASGQRRLCTVVALDVAALSTLADDPDVDAESAARAIEGALTSVVDALGGSVETWSADVLVATFGAARAHENDAERGVAAALRIIGGVRSVIAASRELAAAQLVPRVGVQTGVMLVDDSTTNTGQRRPLRSALVNEALKLASRAPAGAVLIGGETMRHVEALFNVEPLEAAASEPAAYVVTSAATLRAPLPRGDFYGLPTRFLARERQLAAALDVIASSRVSGTARRVEIRSAQGLGRSRMLAEILAALARRPEPHFVLAAQAIDLDAQTPYALVRSLVRLRFGLHDVDDPAQAGTRIAEGIRAWLTTNELPLGSWSEVANAPSARDLASDVMVLGELCARPRDASPESRADRDVEARTSPRVAAALARVLRAIAQAAPVVVLIDNVQVADPPSVRLLGDVLERLDGAPYTVVRTVRTEPGELHAPRADLVALELAPLESADLEALARDRLREVVSLDDDFVRDLVKRAAGSPFVLTEMLQLCTQAGAIERRSDGPWRMVKARLSSLSLPASLHGLVQARLDRLEPLERQVLVLASVLGDVFWQGAVEHLRAASPHAAMREVALFAPQVGAVLERLRAKRVLRRHDPGTFAGEREYAFAEPIMRAVAYDTINQRQRRAYNDLAAEWLSSRARSDKAADRIALHWELAGRTTQAIVAYVDAAEHAAAFSQNEEARNRYERALDLLRDEERMTTRPDGMRMLTFRDIARLHLGHGDILRRVGELALAEAAYTRGETILPGATDDDRLEALAWHARFELRRGLLCRLRGDFAQALALAEAALGRAREAKSTLLEATAQHLLASVHQRHGDGAAAERAARSGLALGRAAPRDPVWEELIADLLSALGSAFRLQKRTLRAERCYRQAVRVAERSELTRAMSFALNDLGAIRYLAGDLAGALPYFERSLALKEREGDLLQVAIALSNVAEVERALGRADHALAHARRAVALGEKVAAFSELPDMVRNVAEASLALGDHEAALDAAERALTLAEKHAAATYFADAAATAARVANAIVTAADTGTAPLAVRARGVLSQLDAKAAR